MFETETVGPCVVWKLKWEGHAPLATPVATPLTRVQKSGFLMFLGGYRNDMKRG